MLSDKKFKRIVKILGDEVVAEFNGMDINELTSRIITGENAISQAVNELESNTKYQDLKESLKALSEGMREVKKYQRSVIEYALELLEPKHD